MRKRATYLYEVGEIVNKNLKIIEQIRVKKGKYTQKGYMVQSLVYPNITPYEYPESYLKRGSGCAYVAGKRITEENSLYSIEWARKYIVNIEQAKTIRPQSNKSIILRCPCGKEKKMKPSNLINQGFSCIICEKGTSYPELFFIGYNDVKKAGFIPQQRFDDFPNHVFDFVNYKKRIIVETHGMQHYRKGIHWGSEDSYVKTEASDKRKREYCKENNWTFIELDCRISSFEHIGNSIANEPLLEDVTDEDVEGILETMENNKYYPVKEICSLYVDEKLTTYQIGDKLGFNYQTINDILRRNNIKIRSGSEARLRGRVLDENKIVELYTIDKLTTVEIAELYNVSVGPIYTILNKNSITLSNGFLKPKRRVKNIENGIIYESASDAARTLNIAQTSVSGNARGKYKYGGKHPITGEPLHWEYVD